MRKKRVERSRKISKNKQEKVKKVKIFVKFVEGIPPFVWDTKKETEISNNFGFDLFL